jgi:hypothetical protein
MRACTRTPHTHTHTHNHTTTQRQKVKQERESISEAFRPIPNTQGLQAFYNDRARVQNGLPGVDTFQASPEVRKKVNAHPPPPRQQPQSPRQLQQRPDENSPAQRDSATPRSAPLARKALPVPPAQRESLSAGKSSAVIAPIGRGKGAAPAPPDEHPPLLDNIKRAREQKVETLRSKSAEKQRLQLEQREAEEQEQAPVSGASATKTRTREASQISQPIIGSSKVIPGQNGRGSVAIKRASRAVPAPSEEAPAPPAPEPKHSPPLPARAAKAAPAASKPAPLLKKPSDAELALEAHERLQDEQKSQVMEEQRQAEDEKKRAAAEIARKKKAEVEVCVCVCVCLGVGVGVLLAHFPPALRRRRRGKSARRSERGRSASARLRARRRGSSFSWRRSGKGPRRSTGRQTIRGTRRTPDLPTTCE